MGFAWVSKCEHVPTGLYRFKDAKMSTRKGNFVTLEDVLSLATARVKEVVEARKKSTEAQVQVHAHELTETTAEQIAIGAVIFHDLSTDPSRDVEFDVERIVDFEGETGPYLQYAHTRCLSILRKAADAELLPKSLAASFSAELVGRLGAPEELALVKLLGQFPLHLERSLRYAKASQLAHYLVDVTHAFGAFYRECRVLGDDRELSQARLMLVDATRRTLAQGLSLLLIPLPERM